MRKKQNIVNYNKQEYNKRKKKKRKTQIICINNGHHADTPRAKYNGHRSDFIFLFAELNPLPLFYYYCYFDSCFSLFSIHFSVTHKNHLARPAITCHLLGSYAPMYFAFGSLPWCGVRAMI